jgi:hypothetical protein
MVGHSSAVNPVFVLFVAPIRVYSRAFAVPSCAFCAFSRLLKIFVLLSRSRGHIPETDTAFELPHFRFVPITGGTQFLERCRRSLKRMMVTTKQEGRDHQRRMRPKLCIPEGVLSDFGISLIF